LNEWKEIKAEVYENFRRHKQKAKLFHDRHIHSKEFFPGQKVQLYDSKLHHFSDKLISRWTDPFIIFHVFPHGAIGI